MRELLMILLAVVATQAITFHWSSPENADGHNIDQEWESFKKSHRRFFHSPGHEEGRKGIFENNLRKIKRHNKRYSMGLESFSMGVNQFTDMTWEELSRNKSSSSLESREATRTGSTFLPSLNIKDLPKEVDWVKEGYVTYVKNQGHDCDSDYAFSVTGAIEGQHFRKTGKLIPLSEQNIIDCSFDFKNDGCYEGATIFAYEYIMSSKGIDTEESYPYWETEQKCRFKKDSIGATISGFVNIESLEDRLQEAVATVGPISVVIYGELESFLSYEKGIYYDAKCKGNATYSALVAGYGTENGQDYWLVKNSWGAKWGEKGYIRMARNRDNHCGIASKASYPLV